MELFESLKSAYLIGGVIALIATILVFVYVMPRRNDGKLGGGFLQFLHELFHFKKLYLENILKFFYVLTTFAAVFCGLLGLILSLTDSDNGGNALICLGVMLLGPVVLRLLYELGIMGVMLVRNVVEINQRLKSQETDRKKERKSAAREEFRQPVYVPAVFCPVCGAKYNAKLTRCPNCGRPNLQR